MPQTIYEKDEVYLSDEDLRSTIIASDKAELVFYLLKELEKNGIDNHFKDSVKIESVLEKFKNELHEIIK